MKKRYYQLFVNLELIGPNISKSLNTINEAGIELLCVNKIDEITCFIKIRKRHLTTLYLLCEKQGDSLRILHTSPIFGTMLVVKQHIILISFLMMLLLSTLFIPNRILFVRVSGNSQISAKQIITVAEKCGLYFGIRRQDVRSEKIKNQLLVHIPQLQWVGVNTKGCVAVINVRERFENEKMNGSESISNIVASADGFILSGTASKGTALFYQGQSVQKGQVLISAYTDCGQYLKAVRSEGEIYAQTSRNMIAIAPSSFYYRVGNQSVRKKYSLIIGKKRINLWKDSGISDVTCGRIYKEYRVRLPGGFDVPVVLCVETFMDTNICQRNDSQRNRIGDLKLYLEEYLLAQMIAGTIVQKDYEEHGSSESSIICGSYICREMIGREKTIEFGDFNGKNS